MGQRGLLGRPIAAAPRPDGPARQGLGVRTLTPPPVAMRRCLRALQAPPPCHSRAEVPSRHRRARPLPQPRRGAVAGADAPPCLRRAGLVPPSAALRRWRRGRAGVPPRERGGAAAEARHAVWIRPWCGRISPPPPPSHQLRARLALPLAGARGARLGATQRLEWRGHGRLGDAELIDDRRCWRLRRWREGRLVEDHLGRYA